MTVAVVGLGLIGGSLAKALARAGHRVIGVDRPRVARRALRQRAIAAMAPTPEAAAAEADVVVLAAPPRTNLALLGRVARVARARLVVTDVGSVKQPILARARRLGLARFVGGHPMAGSERAGLDAASGELFRGRPWFLVPGPAAPAAAVRRIRALVRAAGARPVELDAASHDRLVAYLSHVPQLAAWALLEAARGEPLVRRHLDLAGPGFRDMTRLARSPRGIWREILGQNRPQVARALSAFRKALGR